MKEFNWIDGYDYGSFRDQKFYAATFKKLPNKYVLQVGDGALNLANVDIQALKTAYPDCVITVTNIRSNKTTSCVDNEVEEENEFGDPFIGGEFQGSLIRIVGDRFIFYIDSDGVIFWYDDQDPEEYIKNIMTYIPKSENKPKGGEIHLVAFNQDYYTIRSKIEPTNVNISENYNDDFLPVFEDIKTFLAERKSGLIVLRGKIGSGKTNLIRHLITSIPGNYILVTNTLASSLASPEFISFMLDHKNSTFILEDCEQILMDRGENVTNAIATILNMSDGLMSDIFNVKFICTFNADINQIDEAILRKGRCFANYEFKELSKEKTKNLLNKNGITLDEYKPLTLAEIYHYDKEDCTQKTKKIGF